MKIRTYLLSLLMIPLWMGCQNGQQAEASAKSILVMGTSAEYPPFEFRKDSNLVGFDIDLAKEITSKLGYELKIIDMEFGAILPALQSGQVDFVMAGMTVTEERKKNVDFSEVYFQNSFALISRKKMPYFTEKDLVGKKLGVQLGSTMEKAGKLRASNVKGLKLISLGKNSILIEELKAGRLDALVMEKVQANAFSKVHGDLVYCDLPEWNKASTEGYAVAFSKKIGSVAKKEDLQRQFNEALTQLKQEGKINQISEKWIGKSQ
jgi:polar amino acid transport system substrate-binding protein